MPGFITHYLFGQELLDRLPPSFLKNCLQKHPHAYALGLQGPDLFAYHPLMLTSKSRHLADACHSYSTRPFLLAMLSFAEAQRKEARAVAFAYLAGFFGHFVLDTHCHPYVYAKTWFYRPLTKSFGEHLKIEADFDGIYLQESCGERRSQFDQRETIRLSPYERQIITEQLFHAVSKTYPALHVSRAGIRHATHLMPLLCRALQDRHGWKRPLFGRLERLIFGAPFLSPMIASDQRYLDDALNRRHEEWVYYKHPHRTSTDSLDDCKAAASACYLVYAELLAPIAASNDASHEALLCLLKNRSYHSGDVLDET